LPEAEQQAVDAGEKTVAQAVRASEREAKRAELEQLLGRESVTNAGGSHMTKGEQ
jgi:hypothetical protein